jgi:CelD/BcsL family acetyltransferase involved in cellulose biosynthesis
LRIVLHREIPNDPILRQQWNDLVLQMEPPEVFYTFEWAYATQAAYSASLQPLLFLAYENDELTGVASLATDGQEMSGVFQAATTGDYCEFLSHPCRRAEFVAAVLEKLRELKLRNLTLANLPEDSATVGALRAAARECGFHVYTRPAYQCARVELGQGQARQALKTSLLGKKKLRHYLRAMEREGAVALTHLHTRDEVARVLPHFVRAHVARFLATGRISNLARPDRQRFLGELAAQFSDAGTVTLSQMTAGGRAVAWNYGFRFRGSWFWYLPTFDSRDESNSPGYCLLSKIIIEACDLPEMQVVDLGLGAEGYKERFGNSARQTLYTALTRSRARHLREVARYRAAMAVKRSPRLEAAIRRALAGLQRAAGRIQKGGFFAFVARLVRRSWERWFGSREVLFYEGVGVGGPGSDCAGITLRPIDLEALAQGVIAYPEDTETHSYLLRSAQRLRAKAGQGFALFAGSVPAHFCWVETFAGFYLDELKLRLGASEPNAVVISDSWTPQAVCREGYGAAAARFLSEQMHFEGKSTWILRSPRDAAYLSELDGAGFQYRYSMRRRGVLPWRAVEKVNAAPNRGTEVAVSR